MATTVHLHLMFRKYVDDQETVEVQGRTIGECLGHLVRRFPDLAPLIFDRDGNLKDFVEIHLNSRNAFPRELDKSVLQDDEIYLGVIFAGG